MDSERDSTLLRILIAKEQLTIREGYRDPSEKQLRA